MRPRPLVVAVVVAVGLWLSQERLTFAACYEVKAEEDYSSCTSGCTICGVQIPLYYPSKPYPHPQYNLTRMPAKRAGATYWGFRVMAPGLGNRIQASTDMQIAALQSAIDMWHAESPCIPAEAVEPLAPLDVPGLQYVSFATLEEFEAARQNSYRLPTTLPFPTSTLAWTDFSQDSIDCFVGKFMQILINQNPSVYNNTEADGYWGQADGTAGCTLADPCEANENNLTSCLKHEYGHTLGIYHTSTEESMMYGPHRPMRNTLSACDRAYLVTWYPKAEMECDAHPDAFVTGFAIEPFAGGLKIKWQTTYEDATEGFELQTGPTLHGPWSRVATIPANGSGVYAYDNVESPYGCYRLREYEVSGDTVEVARDSVNTLPAPPEVVLESGDTLRVRQLAEYPVLTGVFGTEPTGCEWVCIVPDEWVASAVPLAAFWQSRGHGTRVAPLSEVATHGGVREYLQWLYGMGVGSLKYVLLLGDANDHVAWNDYARWTNEWSRPEPWWGSGMWPDQDDHNIIPMGAYPAVDGTPSSGMTAWTPYYASDWPYVDFDADGLPDIAIGRAPVKTAAEVTQFVQKTIAAVTAMDDPVAAREVGMWTHGRDNGPTRPGERALSNHRILRAEWPAYRVGVHELVDEPARPLSTVTKRALAMAELNVGRSVIVLQATGANNWTWGGWLEATNFNWGQLQAGPSVLPFILGLTCDIADIDKTEDPREPSPPLIEQALTNPTAGPWGALGPSRGVWQDGSRRLGEKFLRRVYGEALTTAGMAARDAVVDLVGESVGFTELAKSFVFLGDPLVAIPNGSYVAPTVSMLSENGMWAQPAGVAATFSVEAGAGDGVYGYQWYKRAQGAHEWSAVGSQTAECTFVTEARNTELRVIVTSAGMARDVRACIGYSGESAIPTVELVGPAQLQTGVEGVWYAAGVGGRCCGQYSLGWRVRLQNGQELIQYGVTDVLRRTMGTEPFTLVVEVCGSNGCSTREWPVTLGSGEGGGCPVLDTKASAGWVEENTILGRAGSGASAVDAYRLSITPEGEGGHYRVRVRENEQEFTTLDEVRMVTVDHSPGDEAYALNGLLVQGDRVPAAQVTRATGEDITPLITDSGSGYFVAQAGETLYVRFDGMAQHSWLGVTQPMDGGPIIIDDGDKGGGGEPGALLGMAPSAPAQDVDALILKGTGVLIESPDGENGWRTVAHYYPREEFAASVFDSIATGTMRLVYLDSHKVRFIGRVVLSAEHGTQRVLNLLSAEHSRLGTVTSTVRTAGGTTAPLVPGDTLTLEFAAPPIPEGKVREWFLLSRGVYTSVRPLNLHSIESFGLPTQFALLQNSPNPFGGATTIGFELPTATDVRVDVFDAQGRRVRTLANREFAAGYRHVDWDRRDGAGSVVRPGVYFYTMMAGSFSAQRKMVILP